MDNFHIDITSEGDDSLELALKIGFSKWSKAFGYNEGWGHVNDNHAAFLAIQPCWAWYGK